MREALHQKKYPYRRHRNKKYTDDQVDRMHVLKKSGMTYDEIGKIFGVGGSCIENQLYERGEIAYSRGLKVPDFKGWSFWKDNLC